MADPTPVNAQITDAVTQANVKITGDNPAIAEGQFFEENAQQTGEMIKQSEEGA